VTEVVVDAVEDSPLFAAEDVEVLAVRLEAAVVEMLEVDALLDICAEITRKALASSAAVRAATRPRIRLARSANAARLCWARLLASAGEMRVRVLSWGSMSFPIGSWRWNEYWPGTCQGFAAKLRASCARPAAPPRVPRVSAQCVDARPLASSPSRGEAPERLRASLESDTLYKVKYWTRELQFRARDQRRIQRARGLEIRWATSRT
jgi:hypothetical protein